MLGKLAVRRAPEIHVGIDEAVAAPGAAPGGIILEKLHPGLTLGAVHFKDRVGLPVSAVLSWAFHIDSSLLRKTPRSPPGFTEITKPVIAFGKNIRQQRHTSIDPSQNCQKITRAALFSDV
jgi:hypothetical protein